MQVDPAGQYKLAAVVIFFVFQIVGGHLGVPVILLTLIFRKGMKRHPMLINFLVTWVIYSTSFCILWVEFLQIISAITHYCIPRLYLGKQFGPEPPDALCVFQASAIYGTAVM